METEALCLQIDRCDSVLKYCDRFSEGSAKWNTERHSHPYIELIFYLAGTAEIEAGGQVIVPTIIEEYEQHFSFKLADGYAEEEIAAKLGDPEQLAMQYIPDSGNTAAKNSPLKKIGIGFADIIAVLIFILIAAWGIVIAAAAIAFAAAGACLIIHVSPYGWIPSMPYLCGAIFGIALIALGVLTAVACIYYQALIKQLIKSAVRMQQRALAAASGKAVLPPLPVQVRFAPATSRRLRKIMLTALLIIAVFFILGFIVCAIASGGFDFWHKWSWFAAMQ